MRKYLIIFLVLSSLQLFSQTTPPKKTAPKTGAAVAPPSPPTAIIDTTAGKLTCVLYPKQAPIGVANFIGLAKGTKDWTNPATGRKMHGVPLYSGTIFHRMIPDFMIQGGDPAGNGTGDPGYKFKNETSPDLPFDRPGRLAYANSGPDTNGSQFFITEVPYPSLNGGYTIFGQCDPAAVELVKNIARMATDGETPLRPVKITHIEIQHGGAAARPPSPRPAAGAKSSVNVKKPAQPQQ